MGTHGFNLQKNCISCINVSLTGEICDKLWQKSADRQYYALKGNKFKNIIFGVYFGQQKY